MTSYLIKYSQLEKIYMLNRLQIYDNLLVNNTFWMAIIYQNAYFLPTGILHQQQHAVVVVVYWWLILWFSKYIHTLIVNSGHIINYTVDHVLGQMSEVSAFEDNPTLRPSDFICIQTCCLGKSIHIQKQRCGFLGRYSYAII